MFQPESWPGRNARCSQKEEESTEEAVGPEENVMETQSGSLGSVELRRDLHRVLKNPPHRLKEPIADPTQKSQRFPRQEEAILHCDLRVRWKVAGDLQFQAAISSPKPLSFCRISGDLAPSTRKSLAIKLRFCHFGAQRHCLQFSSFYDEDFLYKRAHKATNVHNLGPAKTYKLDWAFLRDLRAARQLKP